MKKHIPNFVTLLNLFSGSIAMVFAFEGNLMLASWFIGFAAIFDFLDGLLARLLNARSAIGLQLDSLCDIISFGLVPSVIVYQMMSNTYNAPFVYFKGINILFFTAFLIPAFSALRLAKFNTDDSQSAAFSGLPTPANALFFASLPLVLYQAEKEGAIFLQDMLQNFWFYLCLTIVFSLLMVSKIPLFSLKIKNLKLKENKKPFVLMMIAVVLFLVIKFYALPAIVILYILISLVGNISSAKR
jgi:CDP-diacylglycerol---serine O-phosphatidyltransferase